MGGGGVNDTPRLLYLRERDPVPIKHEAGWDLGPVRERVENLTLARIRSPGYLAADQVSMAKASVQFSKNVSTEIYF